VRLKSRHRYISIERYVRAIKSFEAPVNNSTVATTNLPPFSESRYLVGFGIRKNCQFAGFPTSI
jgi:hypothetical protein